MTSVCQTEAAVGLDVELPKLVGCNRPPYYVFSCRSCGRLRKCSRDDDVTKSFDSKVRKKHCTCLIEMCTLSKQEKEDIFVNHVVNMIVEDELLRSNLALNIK